MKHRQQNAKDTHILAVSPLSCSLIQDCKADTDGRGKLSYMQQQEYQENCSPFCLETLAEWFSDADLQN